MEMWKSEKTRGFLVAFVLTTPGTDLCEKYGAKTDFAMFPSDLHNLYPALACIIQIRTLHFGFFPSVLSFLLFFFQISFRCGHNETQRSDAEMTQQSCCISQTPLTTASHRSGPRPTFFQFKQKCIWVRSYAGGTYLPHHI